MDSTNLKIDSKGRIMLPKSFRESLGIKTGENLCLELDKTNERLLLFPIEKTGRKLLITLKDVSGSLSKVARILADNHVDLIYTESRSVKRKKEAVWIVVADFSNADLNKIKKDLKKDKDIIKVSFEKMN
ncbi:MAG: hypothetical protein COT15_02710 [Candidatus Diapherotrites archaeon CG08_land_8_20_14_0_20_34_12]|nr:MAG: hypothetical protein COT15_02710 [Candidatus Diapherotrites archaeon CG08_land_8_20_14_0_20_34_12]